MHSHVEQQLRLDFLLAVEEEIGQIEQGRGRTDKRLGLLLARTNSMLALSLITPDEAASIRKRANHALLS